MGTAAEEVRRRAQRPMCKTAEDALAQAMLAAVEHPLDAELSDVTFGRYANLDNGWYWELQFRTTVGMTSQSGGRDSLMRRIPYVIDKWSVQTAKYMTVNGNVTGDQG